MLRREGWRDNHKRVHRTYKEEGLSLRHCRLRRSRSNRRRQAIKVATAPNTLWGMDFVSDALFDGRRLRLLPVLDHFTHEFLKIVVDHSLRADDVAEVVARLVAGRGRPDAIKVDNGSEFAGKVMDRWTYENGVELDFARRRTPTDNAMVGSSNGKLRQECLNDHWFLSLADARSKIEAWGASISRSAPTVHWQGKPLRNSPENTGLKQILWRQKWAKSLPADSPAIGGGPIKNNISVEFQEAKLLRRENSMSKRCIQLET